MNSAQVNPSDTCCADAHLSTPGSDQEPHEEGDCLVNVGLNMAAVTSKFTV